MLVRPAADWPHVDILVLHTPEKVGGTVVSDSATPMKRFENERRSLCRYGNNRKVDVEKRQFAK